MILEDIDAARARGDAATASRLDLVLHGFVGAHEDLSSAQGDTLEQRIQALGFDATTAPWVRERVGAYLAAMVCHFGLDFERLQDRFQLELLAAETRCAACGETARCRRFLAGAGGDDRPEEFCPNAPLLSELKGPSS